MATEKPQEQSRNDAFAKRTATKIWQEIASPDNPYLTESAQCHGYDLLELTQKRSFVDVLYLMFRGELPTANEATLLEQLMIALINPGPRHPATRAAMNAGVGSTDVEHILPIALTIYGG
ncbi:MAG: citrate synthase, partial [Pseudomonadota bacterium]|nr:citrate synthase [Pseudomonadota bacterium]